MPDIYRQAEFISSAHKLSESPPDEGREAAFAGRSNSGKSSAINAITDQRNLARTSKTPGRTQQIIFFRLDEQRRLVDLPGYGFAKVPPEIKRHWQKTLELYLQQRQSLAGLMLMTDVRHVFKEFDRQMLAWCEAVNMPVHVLLTKADKLSKQQALAALRNGEKELASYNGNMSIQLFSALKNTGIDTVKQKLNEWLEI